MIFPQYCILILSNPVFVGLINLFKNNQTVEYIHSKAFEWNYESEYISY